MDEYPYVSDESLIALIQTTHENLRDLFFDDSFTTGDVLAEIDVLRAAVLMQREFWVYRNKSA